jgi:RNA polymerase sigma-70 factor, ECF subfamily
MCVASNKQAVDPDKFDDGYEAPPAEPVTDDSAAIPAAPPERVWKGRPRPFADGPERERCVALIQGMAAGDEKALAEFYDTFASTLYGICYKILRVQQEAEDALQEAFVYMWRKAGSYNTQYSSPFSWAVLITRNKSIDRIRAMRRAERNLEHIATQCAYTPDMDDWSCAEPVLSEQRASVRAALARLPEEQRQVLVLAFFGGLTHEEIALQTCAPLGTVKSRIRRGMLTMRESLMEEI